MCKASIWYLTAETCFPENIHLKNYLNRWPYRDTGLFIQTYIQNKISVHCYVNYNFKLPITSLSI